MATCSVQLFSVVICVATVACDSTPPRPPAVFVTPASLTLEDGQTAKLTATLRNPKSRVVRWSSSNVAVATVDLVGTVTGVTNGSADVVVRMVDDSTISTTVPVTISGPAVAAVTVTPAVATVYVGLPVRIAAQLRAADGRLIRGRTVTWTSPDASIADVSSQGIVRGRAPGGPISLVATSEGRTATSLVRVAHAAENCPFIVPLLLGQRTDGRLASGDCEFSLDESYVDVYEITLSAPTNVQIDMVSSDLDSYLGLFDATGVFLGEDDNTGGGRNARITTQLPAGKYRIWVNTLASATGGAYSLTVVQR